jgi:hypothetical protein
MMMTRCSETTGTGDESTEYALWWHVCVAHSPSIHTALCTIIEEISGDANAMGMFALATTGSNKEEGARCKVFNATMRSVTLSCGDNH